MAQYVEEIRVPALVGPTEANAHDHYDIRVSSVISCTRYTHTHTRLMALFPNGPFSGTTQVSRYQKGKTNLDVTEARDSEWQWHQLGHMQVCISLQTDNHASTPPLSFLQAGCPSCHPTNSVKALKAQSCTRYKNTNQQFKHPLRLTMPML